MSKVGRSRKKRGLGKRVSYFCGRKGIDLGLKLAELLPMRYLDLVAGVIGGSGFYLMGKYREIVYSNLEIAFGTTKSREECSSIAKTVFRDLVQNALEVARLFHSDSSLIKEMVSIEGLEYLNSALNQGKGVVAVSAHLGNFALIGPRLIAEGYPFSLILRDPKDEILAERLGELRSNLGIESIPVHPRKVCITRALGCLKKNGILFLQIDQNASYKDLWVDFFGWLVPTFKGPVIFSMRTGAPLLPMFMIRDDSGAGRHKLIIKPPYKLKRTDDKENDILRATGDLTKLIEGYIKQYPSQWWWLHRRWKKARKNS